MKIDPGVQYWPRSAIWASTSKHYRVGCSTRDKHKIQAVQYPGTCSTVSVSGIQTRQRDSKGIKVKREIVPVDTGRRSRYSRYRYRVPYIFIYLYKHAILTSSPSFSLVEEQRKILPRYIHTHECTGTPLPVHTLSLLSRTPTLPKGLLPTHSSLHWQPRRQTCNTCQHVQSYETPWLTTRTTIQTNQTLNTNRSPYKTTTNQNHYLVR